MVCAERGHQGGYVHSHTPALRLEPSIDLEGKLDVLSSAQAEIACQFEHGLQPFVASGHRPTVPREHAMRIQLRLYQITQLSPLG